MGPSHSGEKDSSDPLARLWNPANPGEYPASERMHSDPVRRNNLVAILDDPLPGRSPVDSRGMSHHLGVASSCPGCASTQGPLDEHRCFVRCFAGENRDFGLRFPGLSRGLAEVGARHVDDPCPPGPDGRGGRAPKAVSSMCMHAACRGPTGAPFPGRGEAARRQECGVGAVGKTAAEMLPDGLRRRHHGFNSLAADAGR